MPRLRGFYKEALATGSFSPPRLSPGLLPPGIRRSDTGEFVMLKPGDLILAMDEMAFYNRADSDGHVRESTIYFRDSRTGFLQSGRTVLPATVTASTFLRGDRSESEDKIYQEPIKQSDRTPFASSRRNYAASCSRPFRMVRFRSILRK